MDGRENDRRPFGFERNASRLHDAEGAAEQCLRGGCAEANDDAWLDERDLVLEPRKARANLSGVRRLVQPPRTARIARPLEVLHGVGDVDVVAVDPGSVERVIE